MTDDGTIKIKKKHLKSSVYAILGVAIIAMAFSFMTNNTSSDIPTGQVVADYGGEQVTLDFFVMSQCPYGTQVMDAIAPVVKQLGGALDFEVNYISTDNGDGTFSSLHGEPETLGNIVQLCAAKYNPNNYMDMIVCQDKDARSIPGNWEKCASDNGLNVESIKSCYEGDEGKELLSASAALSVEAGARGSPTIFLNGGAYSGGRGTNDFLRAICNAFEGDRPSACSEIPEPTKVKMVALSDERCAECDTSGVIGQLKGIFPGLEVTEYDYNTEEGKKLYETLGLTVLPVLLFDSTVEDGEGYANVQSYLEPVGDFQSLRIGATFDPNSEICGNEIDDDGNGQVDCDDSACSGEFECMEKKAVPEVELFVMSHCPYGTQIEKGMLPVIELLGDKIDFEVKFCDYAMHGEKELDEQLRQYCIQEEQNDLFIDYLTCFLEAGDGDGCLSETGVDTEKMETCVVTTDEEFKVSENFADKTTYKGSFPGFNIYKEETDKYGITGSPGLVINGVKASSSRDSASLLEAICIGFDEKPSECDEELSSANPSAGFGFGEQEAAASASAGCGV